MSTALEEMLFAGGSLNLKLLGAEQIDGCPATVTANVDSIEAPAALWHGCRKFWYSSGFRRAARKARCVIAPAGRDRSL